MEESFCQEIPTSENQFKAILIDILFLCIFKAEKIPKQDTVKNWRKLF